MENKVEVTGLFFTIVTEPHEMPEVFKSALEGLPLPLSIWEMNTNLGYPLTVVLGGDALKDVVKTFLRFEASPIFLDFLTSTEVYNE